ncbi:FxLYD domain-containing protein [Anaerolineales bacterium HSG25]|nr:FxLYD domain-containing protein [Anaerolineales bacterium HSG25]
MNQRTIIFVGGVLVTAFFAFWCAYATVFGFLLLTNRATMPNQQTAAQLLPTATYAMLESERPESPLLEATGMPLPQPTIDPLDLEDTEPQADEAGDAEADSDAELEILSHSTYVDERGRHHIVGEIRNNSDVPSDFVEVIAQYYDGDELKGANLTFTDPDFIAPGQTVPFDIVILRREHWANNHDYELIVKGYPTEVNIKQAVVVINQDSRLEEGFLYVSGQVENSSSDWHLAKAVVTLYDGNGEVINSRWDYIEKAMIEPGAVASFEVRLEHQTDPNNFNYRIHIEEEAVSPPVVIDKTPTPLNDEG